MAVVNFRKIWFCSSCYLFQFSSSSRGKAFCEAQVVSVCLSLCLPPAAVFQWKPFLFVCHPPTHPGCLPARGASVDNTCAPKDKQGLFSPLTPFPPLSNVCVVFLTLCPIPQCACIMYVHTCIHTHTHIWPHDTNGYSFVVGCSPPAVTRCVNPSVGVCFSVRPLKRRRVPEPGMELRLAEDPAPLCVLPRMSTLCLSCCRNSLWMFSE